MPYASFPSTRWSLVLSGKDGDDEEAFTALEHLAEAYWMPLYSYLRGKSRSHDQAQDFTQGFFAYLLRREFLSNLEPEGGRFRNFLLVCLRRWMKDEGKRASNVVRNGEIAFEPWHEMELSEAQPTPAGCSPEEAFDQSWAREVFSRAIRALEEEWSHRPELFSDLRLTIESPGSVEKYSEIGSRHGMTEGAIRKAVHDLRKGFACHLRAEVRDTVARDEDVEEEMRYLARLLRA